MKKYILIVIIILGLYFIAALPVSLPSVSDQNSKIIEHTFNNRLSVQLPHSTKVIQNQLSDKGQLLYSVYLNNEELLFRGYIQLWRIDDLENFLITSSKNSTFDFKSYSLKPIAAANHNGFIDEWTASFGDLYSISGKEHWLRKKDSSEVLRISFFTDATSFSNEQRQQIGKILDSVRWN